MTKSVDPDQTAPKGGAVCSGSTLFAYAILSGILVYGILRNTIIRKKTFGTGTSWS